MTDHALLDQLRTELPRLLREHPEVRHELWGLMLEAFPSRQEFLDLLQEVRAERAEAGQRFDAMDRRFDAMDRRFEEMSREMVARFEAMDRRFEEMSRRLDVVDAHLREQRVQLSSLGARVGDGLERIVQGMVEEFAQERFPEAQPLILIDEAGELFGVRGATVEFDLYAHNGSAYLVEVKSHLKTGDVFSFHRKAEFAVARLGRPVTKLVIALSMQPEAEALMKRLGIRYRVRAVIGDR